MCSPTKTRKLDKENEAEISPDKNSPAKGPGKASTKPQPKASAKVAFFALGINLRMVNKTVERNITLEGLKPMDVNTSFD